MTSAVTSPPAAARARKLAGEQRREDANGGHQHRWRRGGRGRRRDGDHDGGLPERRRRLERRRRTAGAAASTAARGLTRLRLYRRRETKARVATGSGGLGDPFKGVGRLRRRPTATGDGEGKLRLGGKRPIRIELESTDFQSDLEDDSKREKVEEISGNISPQLISPEKERRGRIWKETTARLG
uniref:Uncharacterized protein n=1 Tax=Oryza sativa subsp. japonica TaxID=39947 RepID=Q8H303_ORYSJ|nr:hypothetical protein [Oryza sativa Japonica Group]